MTGPEIPEPLPRSEGPHISVLLRQMIDVLPEGDTSIGWIMAYLHGRSFGVLLLLLGVLGLIPGISFIAAMILFVPGVQMIFGMEAPRLFRLSRIEVDSEKLHDGVLTILPYVHRLETFVRPRWEFLTMAPARNVLGLVLIGLALLLLFPVPLGNLPPAVAIIFIALGFLEQDGLYVLMGLMVTALSILYAVFMFGVMVDLYLWLFGA